MLKGFHSDLIIQCHHTLITFYKPCSVPYRKSKGGNHLSTD